MAIGTTAAILGSAALGAAGSIAGSKAQKKSNQQAANASQAAADQATAEQRRQFDIAQQNQRPWLTTGTGALNQLASLYGLPSAQVGYTSLTPGGAGQPNGMAGFLASPDYQFRLNEGGRQLTARNAALGIQDSGAAQRSALEYAQNMASGELNNYANRLAGLAGVGQTAANNSAQLGQNYAGAVGQIAQNNAQNLSSSYQQQGLNQANMWGNLAGIGSGLIGQFGGNRNSPTAPGGSLWGLF